jgi:hypothetical protein
MRFTVLRRRDSSAEVNPARKESKVIGSSIAADDPDAARGEEGRSDAGRGVAGTGGETRTPQTRHTDSPPSGRTKVLLERFVIGDQEQEDVV